MSVSIQLTNPHKSYFPGHDVEGHLIIQNDEPLKVKRVTIYLEGKASVRWTEQERYTYYEDNKSLEGFRTVTRSAYEVYISEKFHLDGDGRHSMTLNDGSLSYPFCFTLPQNLPSSFTSNLGLISYYIAAEVQMPFLKFNKRTILPFTVNGLFDLNMEQRAAQPQEVVKVKGPNFCVCRQGQLSMILRLPQRSGFVPGEIVDFQVEISNRSNKRVTGTTAYLKQRSQYYAKGHQRHIQKNCSIVEGEAIEKGEHETWQPRTLKIPSIPPTKLGGTCRIIDVQYFLRVEAMVEGFSFCLDGELPIWIGTIPFRSNFTDFRESSDSKGTSGPSEITAMPTVLPVRPQQGTTSLYPPQNIGMGFQSPHPQDNSKMPFIYDGGAGARPSNYTAEVDVAMMPTTVPFLQNYPDLPPPSYREAVGFEPFSNNSGMGMSGNENESGSGMSAPFSMHSFAPNYVTFNSK